MRASVVFACLSLVACSDVVEVLTPASGTADAAPPDTGPPREGDITGVTVDGGGEHTCATVDGALYCWGSGSRGKLGIGVTGDQTRPARVGIDSDWQLTTAATQHSCALRSDGSVYCFGANDVGQLGVAGVTESRTPVQVELPGPATFVVAEHNHTCALLASGRLYCWG
jgi:alpha-tubulin suppressor-like RCC1 family protein